MNEFSCRHSSKSRFRLCKKVECHCRAKGHSVRLCERTRTRCLQTAQYREELNTERPCATSHGRSKRACLDTKNVRRFRPAGLTVYLKYMSRGGDCLVCISATPYRSLTATYPTRRNRKNGSCSVPSPTTPPTQHSYKIPRYIGSKPVVGKDLFDQKGEKSMTRVTHARRPHAANVMVYQKVT